MVTKSWQEKVNDDQMVINDKNAQEILALNKHAEVANNEMGVIKNDIKWMKDKVNGMDIRIWAIIMGIIAILAKILTK